MLAFLFNWFFKKKEVFLWWGSEGRVHKYWMSQNKTVVSIANVMAILQSFVKYFVFLTTQELQISCP